MSSLRKSFIPLLLLFTLLVAAGCGTASNGSSPAASPAPADSGNATTRTIQDATGSKEFKSVPKRIVALEWTYVEDLLALGVQPVGAADIAGYKRNITIPIALSPDVKDVGTRQEPNLESIAALKPDLIIAVDYRHKGTYEKLNAIAPTILFTPYPAEGGPDLYKVMENEVNTLAAVLDKENEAKAVWQQLDKTLAQAADKLKQANKSGSEFVLTQAFTSKDVPTLRLFTDNSLASQALAKVGLKNAFKANKFELYGYSSATVEALPAVQNAHFLYIVSDDDNIFEKQLKENAVWKGLQFVKDNKTIPLGGSTWPFGGPLMTQIIVEKAVSSLTK